MPLLDWINRKFAKPVTPPTATPPPVTLAPPTRAAPPPSASPAQIASSPPPAGPRVTSTPMTVRLPWLAPFDREMEKVGFAGVHAHQEAPAGSSVWVDETAQKARIVFPDGRVRAWHGPMLLRADPADPSWDVTWRRIEGADPRIMFSPMEPDCDDAVVRESGFEFYPEGIEGQEDSLWPQFVQLVKDPFLNPAGFPLKSGRYAYANVNFNLYFGEDGTLPKLEVIAETLIPPLSFPYKTIINVLTTIAARDETGEPGQYRTEVTGYRIDTGEVMSIKCRNRGGQFFITGAQLTQHIHDGKVEILEIIEDAMPNY